MKSVTVRDTLKTGVTVKMVLKEMAWGTSPVAQWIGMHLQGIGFDPWSWKIPHAMEQPSLWATTTEPGCCSC